MVAIFIIIILALIFLYMPEKLGKSLNPYDIIRQTKSRTSAGTLEGYDHAMFKKVIRLARRLERIYPVNISDAKQEKLQKKINYSGMQKVLSAEDVQAVKVLFVTVSILYFGLFFLMKGETMTLFLGSMSSGIAYLLPESVIDSRAKRRQEKMGRELPSFLTSLAIITDAGLNLVPAIETLVMQGSGKSELLNEMNRALEEIRIGISQKEAFLRLSGRCNVEEIQTFISALIQGIEKGGSGLTSIVRQQSEESWQKRKYKAKELAEKASMKIFLPLLCLVFPAFIIFLVGPMIFSLIDIFKIM